MSTPTAAISSLAFVLAAAGLSGCANQGQSGETPTRERRMSEERKVSLESFPTDDAYRALVDQTIDRLHRAASLAAENDYFDLFTEDATFIGTDATEHWSKSEFRAYAHPYFAKGKGWTYFPRANARWITLAAPQRADGRNTDTRIAWFDELLDHAKYGTCRGSGVVILTAERTFHGRMSAKIAQYNLSVPIPNERMDDVQSVIQRPAGPTAP